MAAAVRVVQAGHFATVFEASRAVGGRARAVTDHLPDGIPVTLDNGQHILIGAYTESLRLMQLVGASPDRALMRLPLTLKFPDELGMQLPNWPAPLDALVGIFGARGWTPSDKMSLLRAATGWQLAGFTCPSSQSVTQLCHRLSTRVMTELIEPLCVSALNTPADHASAQVFLRVMHDSLLGGKGSSNLLLPRVDLSALFPQPAAKWIEKGGSQVRLGTRVERLQLDAQDRPGRMQVNGEPFDAVILATSASNAKSAFIESALFATQSVATQIAAWVQITSALQFEAITTVYAWSSTAALRRPMVTLRSRPGVPAQFVFDRGQLGGPPGLLAFVVSASTDQREVVQAQVLAQARSQLGLDLKAVQTIVEKRATFACTPGLKRPPMHIASRLLACGDYVDGPYPATLEGAVRSGLAAAEAAVALHFGASP